MDTSDDIQVFRMDASDGISIRGQRRVGVSDRTLVEGMTSATVDIGSLLIVLHCLYYDLSIYKLDLTGPA